MARLLPWLEAAAIVVLQAHLLRGFSNQFALHSIDETAIVNQGRAILAGHWSGIPLAWSPVLSAVYALVLVIAPTAQPVSDVVFVGCAVGSPLAVWWMLRAVVPSPAAFVTACAWATADLVLHYGQTMIVPTVYVFNHAVCVTALGFALRKRPVCALVFGLVACIDRAELTPWLLLTVCVLVWLSWRRGRKRSWASIAVVALIAALFAFQQGHRSYKERLWVAFYQHYGLGKLERSGETLADRDYRELPEITGADFPGASSIFEAVKANPAGFFGHLAHNIQLLPGALSCVMFGAPWPLSPVRGAFLLVVGLLACAGVWRGRQWFGERWRRMPQAARVASLASLYSLVVSMVIRPRGALLLPLLTLWFPLIALLACGGWGSLGAVARATRRWRAGAVLTAVVFLVAPFLPRQYPVVAADYRGGRETIAAVECFQVPRNARLVTPFAWTLRSYTGRNPEATTDLGVFLDQASGPESLRRLLTGDDVDYVLLPHALLLRIPRISVVILPEILGPRWQLVGLTSRMICFRRRP